MAKQDTQLKKLTKSIERLIATPVAPIAPIAPIAPVLPIPPIISHIEDNTVIIKMTVLETKVDQIQSDVTDLKKQNTTYVTQPAHDEVVRVQRVHDTDIEALKSFRDTLLGKMWGIGAIAGLLSGVLGIIVDYYLHLK